MWNVKKEKERNYGEEKLYCSGRPDGLVLMPYNRRWIHFRIEGLFFPVW